MISVYINQKVWCCRASYAESVNYTGFSAWHEKSKFPNFRRPQINWCSPPPPPLYFFLFYYFFLLFFFLQTFKALKMAYNFPLTFKDHSGAVDRYHLGNNSTLLLVLSTVHLLFPDYLQEVRETTLALSFSHFHFLKMVVVGGVVVVREKRWKELHFYVIVTWTFKRWKHTQKLPVYDWHTYILHAW